jgi:hypothetical protein
MKKMRKTWKVLICVLFISLPCVVLAASDIVTYKGKVIPVAWQPVETLQNGAPLPSSSRIYYEVYTSSMNRKFWILEEKTFNTWTNMTLRKGRFYVGIRAVREVDGEITVSDISWSYDPDVVQGPMFILQYDK